MFPEAYISHLVTSQSFVHVLSVSDPTWSLVDKKLKRKCWHITPKMLANTPKMLARPEKHQGGLLPTLRASVYVPPNTK